MDRKLNLTPRGEKLLVAVLLGCLIVAGLLEGRAV